MRNDSIVRAFNDAELSLIDFRKELTRQNREILNQALKDKELTILLTGRPYHSDPLIQHKVSNMLAEMGINIITKILSEMPTSTLRIRISYLSGHIQTEL